MKALIEEVNEKLNSILKELESNKEDAESALADIQDKIDNKIEEAKGYKVDVDAAKEEINRLEDEISSLETDLKDLNDRFSNKDLNAIIETGNKEINAQIMIKQKEIAKQRERIAEYTEKARMIKDLLISLKRDKETKKNRLSELTEANEYYSSKLNEIISFAEENPDNLIEDTYEEEPLNEETYEYNNEPIVDDKPIFDAIESIEKEDEEPEESYEYSPIIEEETEIEPETDSSPSIENQEETAPLNDFNLFAEDELEKEPVHEEDLYKSESDNITNLFDHDSNDSFDSFDFQALNDSIDREYENIFGNSEDIQLTDEEDTFTYNTDNNIFDAEEKEEENPIEDKDFKIEDNEFNFFTEPNSSFQEEPEKVSKEPEEEPLNKELVDFFKNNNLDFSRFSKEEQEQLVNNFNLINYTKTLDILRKNNIRLENIYGAAAIFKMIHSELESIISKLLLSGQSTQNISYVLNVLPQINSFDLQDVIESYGANIKEANITDLLIKAKHLKELGGGN